MSALPDIGNDMAYVMSIFQHRVANFQVTKSDLVTEWHGIERLEANGLISFHDPPGDFLAGLDIFYNHDADSVGFVVHDEVSGHEVVLPPETYVPPSPWSASLTGVFFH
jgi:hypothetical protein